MNIIHNILLYIQLLYYYVQYMHITSFVSAPVQCMTYNLLETGWIFIDLYNIFRYQCAYSAYKHVIKHKYSTLNTQIMKCYFLQILQIIQILRLIQHHAVNKCQNTSFISSYLHSKCKNVNILLIILTYTIYNYKLILLQ